MKWKHRAGALLLALAITLAAVPSAWAASAEPSLDFSKNSVEVINGETVTVNLTLSGGTAGSSVQARIIGSSDGIAELVSDTSVTLTSGQSVPVKIKGLAVGETTVAAMAPHPDFPGDLTKYLSTSVKVTVNVNPEDIPLEVKLSAEKLETVQGEEVPIRLDLSKQTDQISSVTWGTRSNPSGRENMITDRAPNLYSYTANFLSSAVGTYDLVATVTTRKGETLKSNALEIEVKEKPVTPPREEPARGISITGATNYSYINRGQSLILNALTTPEDATDPVTWELKSGSGVVDLLPDKENNRRCTVRGLEPGTSQVVAKVKGVNGEFTSDVYTVEVNGITLDKKELEIYEQGDPGTLVASRFGVVRSMNLSWESQSESIASVRGAGSAGASVYGSTTGTAKVIAFAGSNKSYTAECTVTVKENVAGLIERSVTNGSSYGLSGVLGDLRSRCTEMTKGSLKLIRGITVDPGAGILHYNYTSPEFQGQGVGSEPYYVSPASSLERAISGITFVPKNGFSGNADIRYTGESTEGKTFAGIIRIKVTSTGDVTYSTASNLPVVFRVEDFNAICRPKTGQEIRYISFQQPSSGKGTLYRTYSAAAQYNAPVTASDQFYRNSNPRLDEVTFLPAKDTTGTVKIPYRCVTTSGGSYTGTVTVYVSASSSATGKGDVTYSVAPGSYVSLQASDFNSLCERVTGNRLDYVYFDLPSNAQGTLYLNYRSASNTGSKVSQDTRYYRSSSPQISSITFVPASGFTGTVSVPFTAFDRYGESFRGTMVINVTEDDGTVRYSTGENRAITFDGQDFNEACQRVNGASLDYITFDTPSTSRGRLYRNYRSSTSTGSSVTDSTRVFYRGTPAISDVTFVPAKNFNGTVTIPFDGYDSTGAEVSGSVVITVGTGTYSDVISYSTSSGGQVNFNSADFDSVCQSLTGKSLDYVRFSLPASRYGTLYYQYNASRDTGTSVSSSTSYYRSGGTRKLDDITFAAAAGVNGTVSFDYTGRNTSGREYTGTVEITISSPKSQVIRYATAGSTVSFLLSDFRNACSAALGSSLSYIRFTSLPYSGAGQVRLDGGNAYTGTSYYVDGTPSISRLSFVPAAGYWGTATVGYTGWDARGRSYNGTVEITVSSGAGSSIAAFTDLGGYSQEFVTAITSLSNSGIVNGYGDGRFGPGQSVSRGAFALMVCRAFNLNTGATSSFPDVPSDSVYAWAVATARDLGIAEGSNGRFNPGSPITRQAAMTMICRAMRAAGRNVPNVSASAVLNTFGDAGQIAEYARAPVASLVQMGAVRGDASMRLNPTQSISRAQMAVILYRVLNMG